MTAYLLERALVGGVVSDDVLVEIDGGRFTKVEVRDGSGDLDRLDQRSASLVDPSTGSGQAFVETTRVPGLTLPGFANTHSHAFHRALRGRTQRDHGTFWTWRTQMYDLAARLTPDTYFTLARAVYREMAASGITSVGEFHYLHHQPGGTAYADPNAMGEALIAAAREAGLRIALLDTAYLSSGFGAPVEAAQLRFSDGDVDAWAGRVSALAQDDTTRIGAAIHSVRAVVAEDLPVIVEASRGRPLHVHLSEQTKENEDCIAAYGATPTQLLADHGVLGPGTTAVHATHLTDDDIAHLGSTNTNVSFCPTTERDLGDGVGPSRRLYAAGSPITLGSDSHAVIDPFEEMRALELNERLVTERRGHWSAAELVTAATRHASLGFEDAGEIAVGQRADLVTLDLTSIRTAGTGSDLHSATFAATAADVMQVIADGRVVFTHSEEVEIGRELAASIEEVWR